MGKEDPNKVGTSKSYKFINPKSQRLTDVMEHPLQIMECSLDAPQYMNLSFDDAFAVSKKIINNVYSHRGELVLLFHNSAFVDGNYYAELYKILLKHIRDLHIRV